MIKKVPQLDKEKIENGLQGIACPQWNVTFVVTQAD